MLIKDILLIKLVLIIDFCEIWSLRPLLLLKLFWIFTLSTFVVAGANNWAERSKNFTYVEIGSVYVNLSSVATPPSFENLILLFLA